MKKIFLILISLSLLLALFFACFSLNSVAGRSMEPAFTHGTVLLSFNHFGQLNRSDVVIYLPKVDDGIARIGRIVALPNEKVRFENGKIYIDDGKNQWRLEEEYLSPSAMTRATVDGEWLSVGADQYLILTDSRANPIEFSEQLVSRSKIKSAYLFKF